MSSVILYTHTYLGDQLICNGLVREYCKKHDRVAVFCVDQYREVISFMYRDLRNLDILPGDEGNPPLTILLNAFRHNYDDVVIAGTPYLDPYHDPLHRELCEEQFYRVAGIDPAKKWESFHVERDAAREERVFAELAPKGDYIFLHDDARFKINRARIGSDAVASPVMGLTKNIFDYCLLIQKAKEIHVMDSSFMFLVDLLPDFGQKLFVHRYARHPTPWTLPALKKNWTILT